LCWKVFTLKFFSMIYPFNSKINCVNFLLHKVWSLTEFSVKNSFYLLLMISSYFDQKVKRYAAWKGIQKMQFQTSDRHWLRWKLIWWFQNNLKTILILTYSWLSRSRTNNIVLRMEIFALEVQPRCSFSKPIYVTGHILMWCLVQRA